MTFPDPSHVRRRAFLGFTLLELLVVVAIIGILATILVAALQRAMATGRNTKCRSNLHQIHSLALAGATSVGAGFQSLNTTNAFQFGGTETYSVSNRSIFACPCDKRTALPTSFISYTNGPYNQIGMSGGNETNIVYLDARTNVYRHEVKKLVRNVVYLDGHVGTISNNN